MLDVLSYVTEKKAALKRRVDNHLQRGDHLRMAIITDDKNFSANASYIKSKTNFAMDIGVACDVISLGPDDEMPNLEPYTGVIVQYPFRDLTFQLFREFVSKSVHREKDIDGLGYDAMFSACTPLGIVKYIDHLRKTEVLEEEITVNLIGYGGLIGKPLVEMLSFDPSITLCVTRSSTSEWVADNFKASADVIICATPQPNLIKWTNHSKVYIDCGCALIDGKLIGNVSRDCYGNDELITPVPGGVGRLTVVSLFENLLDACHFQSVTKQLNNINLY